MDRATNDLRCFIRLLRGRQLNHPGRIDESIEEHRALMAAMERRDAAAAERVMQQHLLAQLAALKALRAAERDVARRRAEPRRAR
jgi:DNA-binding GntR family transcriptional regulator